MRFPTDPAEIEAMGWNQMRLLAMQLTAPMLEDEKGAVAVAESAGNGRGRIAPNTKS